MPLYEYQCRNCSHRFEKIQKFSDAPLKKCPKCGGALDQVISAPAVQFKGSGWYVTDYARKSHTPSASDGGKTDKSKAGTVTESASTESSGKEISSKETKKSKSK